MTSFINPSVQKSNLIRYVGDRVSESGRPIRQLPLRELCENIGAPSEEFADQLIVELDDQLIKMGKPIRAQGIAIFMNVNLTLVGWEQYEAEKRGKKSENYGFMAMQFNDAELDSFVESTVKPAVNCIGYDLVNMRDVSTAGIIDNIMSVRIRNAAFVIADLTHDNSGAYWEAGYAEGLGKPVVYICERGKFEATKTHFDTNHRTTITWCKESPEEFSQELVATLSRSLADRVGVEAAKRGRVL